MILTMNDNVSSIENNFLYFNNSILMIRFIGGVWTIFFFSYSFISRTDQYVYLICTARISRVKYFVTKIMALLSWVGLFVWIEYVLFLLIGFSGYQRFIFSGDSLNGYFNCFLLMVYYGFLSLFLIQIINNIFTLIIPVTIMNVGIIINENASGLIYRIYNFFFPNFVNDTVGFVFGVSHILFMIIFLFVLNLIIYYFKDL